MAQATQSGTRKSPFLCVTEAADYLGLTRSTLDHYRWAGGGPKYRKHGGRVFYHIDDLEAWSARRTYNDTATRAQ